MKSVKAKLFSLYAITITAVLALLTFVSLYFLQINKKNNTIELLNTTSDEVYLRLFEDGIDIKNIDKYLDLKNQFLLLFKDGKLIFTNQSSYKTQEILREIEHENEEYEDRDAHHDNFYEELREDGFIQVDDYIFVFDYYENKDTRYEIYLGINKELLEESIDDIYELIIIFNIVIFIILLGLGYILINKTISPLKQILNEINKLQNENDLDKRLAVLNTGDEFEELTKSFNIMLFNIQRSVESIKQFSSDASHELKTPLTIIQGEIELCKNKDLSKEELTLVLKKIDKEQIKLQNIINSFLLLSRLEKEQILNKKTKLDEIIFETIEANLEEIENKNLELKLDIDENLEINFDENYLAIVLNNLISNAYKYTNEGHIKIETKKQNGQIILNISDTGIGINSHDIKKIFDRFYRVDKVRSSSADGLGLGLSIVKKICDKFNTKIKVKSSEGKGTNFTILFNQI